MSEIETALAEMVTLIKTLATVNPPEARVWRHPGQSSAIRLDNFPAVVVTKMNAEPGAWKAGSYGVGRHEWEMLVAVFLADGPVVVTNSDDRTIAALEIAHEWYKLMADLLYENMTLSSTVDIIGDEDGKLFDYITDNIIWDGKHYYGHLFVIPIVQEVIQGVSS